MNPIQANMTAPAGNSASAGATGTSAAGGNSSTGTAGNSSFVQALAQVMNESSTSETGTPGALVGLLLPGLLGSTSSEGQGQEVSPAQALLQLLNQLLNGTSEQADSDATAYADGSMDTGNALAQLQLLLLQWLSSAHSNPTAGGEANAGLSVSSVHTDEPGQASRQLLLLLTAMLEQQSNQAGAGQPSVESFKELLKPVLAEIQAAAAREAASGTAQAAVAVTNAAQPNEAAAGRESLLITARKPIYKSSNAPAAASQPLVQLVADGRSYTGLSMLAARANLQAPVSPVPESGAVTASPAEASVPVDAIRSTDSEESTQGTAVFRMPTATDAVVKADAPVSAHRFAQEMSQLMKSMNMQATGGHSAIKITLMPEHLGQVDVKMSMQNGHLVAQFVADTVHGKDMLESQLPQLRAVLQSQGLQVDRLEVAQGQAAAFASFQEQRQQQSSQQFNRKQQGPKGDGEDLAIDFDAELAQLAARRAALAGSSFDVSA
ncbi:flagellar hook-length control protein FliK [Paenibacillus sp. HJGM_3]|uniref:flagellar hook-length control protein FliK n=1 Tax=Paenibacillus sp. HJGM_3 TaxID=3379816 RepID=UPI00385E53A9